MQQTTFSGQKDTGKIKVTVNAINKGAVQPAQSDQCLCYLLAGK